MSEREGDGVRQETLKAITNLSDRFPDLRICQLIENSAPAGGEGGPLYYVEDSQLLEWLLTYEVRIASAAALLKAMKGDPPQ